MTMNEMTDRLVVANELRRVFIRLDGRRRQGAIHPTWHIEAVYNLYTALESGQVLRDVEHTFGSLKDATALPGVFPNELDAIKTGLSFVRN